MAQVPYAPVPTERLSGSPLAEVHPNVPVQAFGGDVAQAVSGMGKAIEGAGSEIYERAIWLQNLNNQAEARQASSDYTIAAGQLHAKYNSLEGKNAVDAYPKYSEDLKTLRGQYGNRLSSPMAQRMYDSETMGTMSHAIFNGGSHAASQQKAFVKGSMDADISSTFEQTAQNPKDDIAFNKGLRNVEGTVRQKGALEGLDPKAIDNNVTTVTSKFWANKFESLAKESPFIAQSQMYENREKMLAADFKRLESVVGTQVHAVGSVNIATDLIKSHTDDEGNLTVPVAELQAKARQLAEKMSPDDALFPTQVVRALDSQFNQQKYANRQQKWDNLEAVNGAIGAGASSVQELLADPKTYAAYMALPKAEQLKIPARIDSFIKARDRGTNERAMTELMGLKNNDVESFLNLAPDDPAYKLSQAQIRQVMTEQQKVKKSTAQDPRVDRAMGWMRGGFGAQMEAMGVFRRSTGNKAEYDHLTGAVQQALDIWQEDHKKPPTNKEFNEQIAPEILKVQKTPGFLGLYGGPFGTDKTIYKHDTFSKEYKAFESTAKADVVAKGGTEPSEEEIYKAYTRLQLLKLYPAKKKVAPDGE